MLLLLWSLIPALAARPTQAACESASRAVSVLWTARALADAVSPAWPGWRPALVEVRYRTLEGYELRVGREEEASCRDLPVPARIVGRKRPARRSEIRLHRRGERFWVELVEGTDGLALEDELATLVHLHFHVHQYRHDVDYREVNPRGDPPGAAWAFHNLPATEDTAKRMGVIAQEIVAEGFTPERAMALLTLRRRHAEALREGHPRLPAAIRLQEQFEGAAVYVENQLVQIESARKLLVEAGVREADLDPGIWRKAGLRVGPDYPGATGYASALVLDAAGAQWKEDLYRVGFDSLIDLAVIAAVK